MREWWRRRKGYYYFYQNLLSVHFLTITNDSIQINRIIFVIYFWPRQCTGSKQSLTKNVVPLKCNFSKTSFNHLKTIAHDSSIVLGHCQMEAFPRRWYCLAYLHIFIVVRIPKPVHSSCDARLVVRSASVVHHQSPSERDHGWFWESRVWWEADLSFERTNGPAHHSLFGNIKVWSVPRLTFTIKAVEDFS